MRPGRAAAATAVRSDDRAARRDDRVRDAGAGPDPRVEGEAVQQQHRLPAAGLLIVDHGPVKLANLGIAASLILA